MTNRLEVCVALRLFRKTDPEISHTALKLVNTLCLLVQI